MRTSLRLGLPLGIVLLGVGCHVANRRYNPVPNSIVAITPAEGPIDRVDAGCTPSSGKPCLAFIEFDEQGEFWDPRQLPEAVALVRRGSTAATPPLVVLFVHGWKNNADNRPNRKNGNVLGFEGTLEYLASGRYEGVPVVGIYIGWRGDLVSKYWPMSRQFSYFNREGAAIRVPGASMTSALTQVMLEAHRANPAARIVMIGHSFGALVLERALTQAMTDFVLRSTQDGSGSGSPQDGAWADLVIFVNSAAAASEGKQMIDVLKGRTYVPQGTDPSAGLRGRPLFLSISSLGDAATRFALPVGHGPGFLGLKTTGSWREYENPDPPTVRSQSDYYRSTTAHMQALQSHLVVDTKDAAQCAGATTIAGPIAVPNGHSYQVCEKPGRWNTTPYWAMQMPASLVRDHSGIFNENFITFLLEGFLPSGEEMRAPRSRQPLFLPAR